MAALLLLLVAGAAATRLGSVARHDSGDLFTLTGECNPSQCGEHGAKEATDELIGTCACACPSRAPLFREDRELCVDDLPDVKTPICAVSGAQFLTPKGFLDLRNTLDADVPFNLFRDEGRTFLQWSGENDVRARMSGRLMVVRLLCRDVDATPTSPMDLRGVFTPCVAFRVQGTPQRSNVTEVQFASNAQTSDANSTSGLSVSEYVAIGISSLLLGLVYVASVFLFLHIRKRRKAASDEGDSIRRLKGLKKKDGSAITERDIVRVNNDRIQTLPNAMGQDNGIVKKNPLLSMNRFHDGKGFTSDSGSNLSDSEDFTDISVRSDDNMYNIKTTAALIHQHREFRLNDNSEIGHRDESGIERLPDEHVSIVETIDDREIARPVGTTRRKLYFNPAYFEPHLMVDPPAAALEFLVKIREVISIAKHKMESKRFQPILNEIPEEETYSSNGNSIDIHQGLGSQRSGSVISLKRENSRRKDCVGCPGCTSIEDGASHSIKYITPPCTNCLGGKGDKQSSIRKWLENISSVKNPYNEFHQNTNQHLAHSLLSHPENQHRIIKQNSFTSPCTMLMNNEIKQKKSSSMSVRSEPTRRTHHFNLPLPEFENVDYHLSLNHYYAQTISQTNDISPIGLNNSNFGSMRSKALHQLRNKNALPDMINEAIALDHCTKTYNQSSSDDERFGINTRNIKPNSLPRNTSENSLTNDYETDSLERNPSKTRLSSTTSEYPDIPSSQASPSLSNALPLEEELTMRNAVYKTHSSSNSNTPSPQNISQINNDYEIVGMRKNGEDSNGTLKKKKATNIKGDYSLVSEVYVNNNYNFGSSPTSPSGSECSMGSRKLFARIGDTEEKPGCLTIEVMDSPENYIKINESDDFEPDTLDRKHLKPKLTDTLDRKPLAHKYSIDSEFTNFESNDTNTRPSQRIQLKSNRTFKKPVLDKSPNFHSLRKEYEESHIFERPKISSDVLSGSKSLEETIDDMWEESPPEWVTEEGRILTLEHRHSKRQRQSTPPTIKQIKNLARPDVLPPLPPSEDPIYEQPAYPPRRVENEVPLDNNSKNLSSRSLSPRTFSIPNESSTSDFSLPADSSHSPCSPLRASVQSQSSEYENTNPKCEWKAELKTPQSPSISTVNPINTGTFVKGKAESKRFRRKKCNIQDSGYLSSDSGSRQKPRKLVVAKIVSCSESDDTENEARSESGAESVETHSVYFDNFRNPNDNCVYKFNNGSNSSRGSERNKRTIKDL